MSITAADDFAISLDFFSGPMDLLLHLVHQQEVAIEQVSMRLIAEQYLNILLRARLLDLDKASEYLVIAATLMSIKSASLLPAAAIDEADATELEENSEKFYEELRAKLRAYQLTQSRAQALIELPQLGVNVYSRNDRAALLPTPEMLAEPEEVNTLASLFGKLIRRVGGAMSSYRIRLESISVVSYMMRIVDALNGAAGGESIESQLQAGTRRSFREFVRGFLRLESGGRTREVKVGDRTLSAADRGVITGSFIAVLELMKRGLLSAVQREDAADIEIQLKMAPADNIAAPDQFTSEFDAQPESESASAPHDGVINGSAGDEHSASADAESNVVDFEKYKRDKHSHAVEKPIYKEVSNSGS
ncbi:MAG: segregation/condensation protein A [Bdellovibrionota bacterium]